MRGGGRITIIAQVFCWVVTTQFGLKALEEGNVQKLLGGLDYAGRICGYSGSVVNLYKWNIVSWDGSGKCIDECPTVSTWNEVNWFDKRDVDLLICKDETNSTAWWRDYPFFLIYYGECMFKFASTDYVGFCVLDDMTIFSNIFEQYFEFDDAYVFPLLFLIVFWFAQIAKALFTCSFPPFTPGIILMRCSNPQTS